MEIELVVLECAGGELLGRGGLDGLVVLDEGIGPVDDGRGGCGGGANELEDALFRGSGDCPLSGL